MMKKRLTRLTAVAAVAMGLSLLSAGGAAGVVGDTGSTDPAEISCQSVSLTIELPEHNPDPADEGVYPYGDGSGYNVRLSQVVDVDLMDRSSWDSVRELTPAAAKKLHLAGAPYERETGADKKARFDGLPVGVYLVTVTPPVVPGQQNPDVADFVVTAPLAGHGGWMCDGVVYAKSVPTVYLTPPELTPPPPEQPTPKGEIPRTGAAIGTLVGIALIAAGIGAGLVSAGRTKRGE